MSNTIEESSRCIVHMFTTQMDDGCTAGLVRAVFVQNMPDEAKRTLRFIRYSSLDETGTQKRVGVKHRKVRPILDFTFDAEILPQSGCWVIPADIRSFGKLQITLSIPLHACLFYTLNDLFVIF